MGKTYYQDHNIVIGIGDIAKVNVAGRYLVILDNSSSTDPQIQIGEDQSFQSIPAGISIALPTEDDFTVLQVKNVSGVSQTIRMATAFGKIFDSRFVASATIDVKNASNLVTTLTDIGVTATATSFISADSNVREIIVQNLGANNIYLGGSTLNCNSTLQGTKIQAGDILILSVDGAMYAQCKTGLTSTLSVNKLERV